MKYIRTKDGIFEIEKYGGIRTIVKIYDVDESLRIKYENTNEPQQVEDQFIIIDGKDYKIIDSNVADTIEELIMPGDLVRYEWLYMSWIEKDRGDKVRGIDMHLIDRESVCDLWIPVGEKPDFKLVASKSKDDEKLCLIQ